MFTSTYLMCCVVVYFQMIAEEFSHTVLHKNPAQVRAPLHPIRPQADHVIPHQRPAAKNGTTEFVFFYHQDVLCTSEKYFNKFMND